MQTVTAEDAIALQQELIEIKNELTHLVHLAASEDVDASTYALALAEKYGIEVH